MYHYNKPGLTQFYSHNQLLTLDNYIWDVLFDGRDSWHPYHDDLDTIAQALLYNYYLFLGGAHFYALFWDLLGQIGEQRGIEPRDLSLHLNMTALEALRDRLLDQSQQEQPASISLG